MRNENLISTARDIEKQAGKIRAIQSSYMPAVEEAKNYAERVAAINKVNALRFAGSLCSMASSILCEFYECEDSGFDLQNANNVLREWGLEELS